MTDIGRLSVPSFAADTDSTITPAVAAALRADGFRAVVRYLSLTAPQNPGDLDAHEIAVILGAGLALGAVQHATGVWLSAALGAAHGGAAGANARQCGLPPGITLWLDLETARIAGPPEDTIAYVNAWSGAILACGWAPGLYVGAGAGLSSEDLFWRLRLDRYWRSMSDVPDVAHRGYCMVQSPTTWRAGIAVDANLVLTDHFGGAPVWALP